MRYKKISIYNYDKEKLDWLVIKKNTPIPNNYEEVVLELKVLTLLKKID